jgi:hypothetical protein
MSNIEEFDVWFAAQKHDPHVVPGYEHARFMQWVMERMNASPGGSSTTSTQLDDAMSRDEHGLVDPDGRVSTHQADSPEATPRNDSA